MTCRHQILLCVLTSFLASEWIFFREKAFINFLNLTDSMDAHLTHVYQDYVSILYICMPGHCSWKYARPTLDPLDPLSGVLLSSSDVIHQDSPVDCSVHQQLVGTSLATPMECAVSPITTSHFIFLKTIKGYSMVYETSVLVSVSIPWTAARTDPWLGCPVSQLIHPASIFVMAGFQSA